MAPRSQTVQERVYRALLLLYPPSFRREYGPLMTQAFSDRRKDAGFANTWFLVAGDLWTSVPQQILEVSLMSQVWTAVFTSVAAIAVVVGLSLGAGPPLVVMTGAVALVGIVAFGSTRRSGRSSEHVYGVPAPKTWTWWTVLAAGLAAVYMVAAVGQLIDEPKADHVGALAIMAGFAALIAIGLRLRSRGKLKGNWMVMFATIPALMFFWVIGPTIVAIAIIVGASTELFRSARRPAVGAS